MAALQAFIDTVKNGFVALIDTIQSVISFVLRTAVAFGKLLMQLPDVLQAGGAAINMLPEIVLSAALFCLSVRLIIMIVQKKAGSE